MSSKVDPEILRLYTIRRRLGKGVHGAVWKAVDRWTGEVVAIKKIYNAFRNLTDAQRTFREVIFLKASLGYNPLLILLHERPKLFHPLLRLDRERF
uniref:Protein kinase domain-containing protein n=1 Tax=Eptatretus burgeri TaxID=7764 RepID=A0A8C4Q6A4_EPTBU